MVCFFFYRVLELGRDQQSHHRRAPVQNLDFVAVQTGWNIRLYAHAPQVQAASALSLHPILLRHRPFPIRSVPPSANHALGKMACRHVRRSRRK